jgi:hypothetical protein
MINQDQQQDVEKQQEPSKAEVAAYIADMLGETEEGPRKNIERIVRAVGRTHAKELLSMTLQTEENGGLMLSDGSRRRTPGGVFFHLAYSVGKTKNGKPLQRPWNITKPTKKPIAEASTTTDKTTQPSKPQNRIVEPKKDIVFNWEDRIPLINEAMQEKGSASTMKITIVGRPGKVLDKDQFIVTVIESTKIPSLPKGLPAPTNAATKYAVYIAKKQWNKVKDAIQDPEDALIIEGFPKTDAEVSAIAVFTTNVTTKKLQQATREKQQTAVN